MKKIVFALLLVSVSAYGFCQQEIKLGDAKPIDIHVLDVTWQPAGNALVYRRETEKGFGLGVFSVNGYEGKVVIPLAKGDTWDTFWLANSNSALVMVRSLGAEEKTQVKIFLVDADKSKATPLFDQAFDTKKAPYVEVDTSPSLKHAIVTFRNSEGSFHKVLCLGGGNLVDSADLDRAEKEGLSGPNWSVDGTAIYSNSSGKTIKTTNGEKLTFTTSDTVAAKSSDDTSAFQINVSAATVDGASGAVQISSKLMLVKFGPPMPPTGSSVFELMTGSPVLRPVRFRGPWVWNKAVGPKLISQNQSLALKFDQSNAQDTSVWLTRGTVKGTPASLVAVHANNTWLSEAKNGITYVIDGALFFRSIGN